MSLELDQRELGLIEDRRRRLSLSTVALGVAFIEFGVLMALAIGIGQIYWTITFDNPHALLDHIRLGAMIACLYSITAFVQGAYAPNRMTNTAGAPDRLALALACGLFLLLAILFLTKTNTDYSRAVVTLSFALGFPALWAVRLAIDTAIAGLIRTGVVAPRMILLVGDAGRMATLADKLPEKPHQSDRIERLVLAARAGDPAFASEIQTIVEIARRSSPEYIVLCMPWSDGATAGACIDRLMEVPSAIHLKPETEGMLASPALAQFFGPLGLKIVGKPFRSDQAAIKRNFDLLAALSGLIVLSPLLVLIALMVRLDSKGPVLFRQRRYGVNRESFHVYKFRTMRTSSAPAPFRQAKRDDERITAVGRFLRRTNLDELPQLLNVVMGDMSLVGPRPHPVELDDAFASRIAHYSMRHRVRPGITGWAQINGYRGITDTDDKMEGRISHDLYYLSNWSFWLDIQILLRTVLSAKSYDAAG